jgi:ATP-dependent Clp protease ATP-binding subunit ClpX
MVAGPDEVYICDRCVTDAAGIVQGELASMSKRRDKKYKPLLKPTEIKARLDDYVIGQEEARRPFR